MAGASGRRRSTPSSDQADGTRLEKPDSGNPLERDFPRLKSAALDL
jgi:hypothetical protein